MNAILVVQCLILFGGLSWKGSAFPSGEVIDTVTCRSDPSQSYALYIPAERYGALLPVVYFFDSHGAGAYPVKKYRGLADEFGCILVGSNNSKNGTDWPTTERIWRCLAEDTRERLRIDTNRMYAAGFSGGAKVAGFVAIIDPRIRDVIVNGAGLPDEVAATDFPFGITALTGTGDMNMTQLVGFDGQLDHTRTRHRLILFTGKHEWAPRETMKTAFEGLFLDGMASGRLPANQALIGEFVVENKARVERDAAAGSLTGAARDCVVAVSYLDGLSPEAAWFRRKAAALEADPRYRTQEQARERWLTLEDDEKAEFMKHFQAEDLPYWTKTVADLDRRAIPGTAEGDMCRRLLAFLSLTFYSVSNQLIASDHDVQARYFVRLYQMADPSNSEAWYFAAILDARDHASRETGIDLQKAISLGFRDRTRMKSQPEFLGLNPPLDFSGLERLMK